MLRVDFPRKINIRIPIMKLMIIAYLAYLTSFNNYVHAILPSFDLLPTSKWTFSSLNMDKKMPFRDHLQPTHLILFK